MSVQREIRERPILTSQTSWRVLTAGVCLGLLLWLVFQPSPTERRRTAIDNALREGRIGQLSPDQTAWLSTTLSWMAGAAGVTDPVALNAPFLAGRLHVYTTTPASSTITHCGRGNAVYDAELDAIFLDQGLFDNNDFRTFLSASVYGSVVSLNDLPFVQTYVRFLILHELGHRKLHRKRAAQFDSDASSEGTREQEADAFALDRLQVAYAMPQARSNNVGAGGAEMLEMQYDQLTNEERALVDLIGMTTGMNLSLLFISNPYAPFYRDNAHATFLTRSRGLLRAAGARTNVSVRIAESIAAVDELLQREESALGGPLVEILAPDPIADVSYDKDGLLVTSVELKKLFHVDGGKLSSFLSSTTTENHFRSMWIGNDRGANGSVDDWWKLRLWSLPTGETFAWPPDGSILQAEETGWKAVDNSRWRPVTAHLSEHLFVPLQPSLLALAESDDSDRHTWLSSVTRDGVLASRSEASISSEIQQQGSPSQASVSVLAVTDRSAYLSVQDSLGELWGISEFDLATMTMRSSTKLRFPPQANRLTAETALSVSPGPIPRVLMISATGRAAEANEFAIWQLSPTQLPDILVTKPYFHSRTPHLQSAFGGQSVADVVWLPGGKLLVGIGNDSLYIVDLTARTAMPVFHPGDEIIKKRVGRNGLLAIFVQGGYKCYVMRVF